MVSNRTGKDPVSTLNAPAKGSNAAALIAPADPTRLHAASAHFYGVPVRHLLGRLLHHPTLHLRAALRLLHRRRTFATALLAGGTTAAAALGAVTVNHFRTPAAPLAAPRPVPSAAEALAAAPQVRLKHHRIAEALSGSLAELQRISDLHPLRGIATWYGAVLHGHKTASGETFDETLMTAAHRTLPLGTVVRVTDVHTKHSVVVRINDRGTLAPGRVIDLSSAAAEALGILRTGIADVKLEVLKKPAQS